MPVATVSSKGQIVIPRQLRELLGLREGSRVEIGLGKEGLVLRPSRGKGRSWERWRGAFAKTGLIEEHRKEHTAEVARDVRRRP